MTRKTLFLNGATILFAVPFVLFLIANPIFWLAEEVTPLAMIIALPFASLFFSDLLFSNLWLYVMISLCALLLTVGMLIRLVLSERLSAWQQKRFYLLLLAIISVLAPPFLKSLSAARESDTGRRDAVGGAIERHYLNSKTF